MKLPNLSLTQAELSRFQDAILKEWLITNELGGYASSTVLGINTRKYHGLLVAALHPPGDRTVCLSKLDEEISVGDVVYSFGANEFQGAIYPEGHQFLKSFSVAPFPQYVYDAQEVEMEKTFFMPTAKNAVVEVYKVLNRSTSDAKIRIAPLMTCRHFHSVVDKYQNPLSFTQHQNGKRNVQLAFNLLKTVVTVQATEGEFYEKPNWIERLLYREELMRGESSIDDCYQPGFFEVTVPAKREGKFAVIAVVGENSQANVEVLDAVGGTMPEIDRTFKKELEHHSTSLANFYGSHVSVQAVDWLSWILQASNAFIVKGVKDRKRIIAGYPWFESWGRDTFISLPGLMLVTGRFEDARNVLSDFAGYCRHGLIPNFLQDQSGEAAYNTVDATLWYVNAVLQYLKYTGDFRFVHFQLWEILKDIIKNHVAGMAFGIHVDANGLLAHGARLTWMDAEVDGEAVTPRVGKAVEIQALWYNALRTMQLLAENFREKTLAETYATLARKAQASFTTKFWNNQRNCLFDIINATGGDASLRPNQVIAAALDFTMLDQAKNAHIVDVVKRELLTPCGLRTLERNDSRYRGVYLGDRRSRDQAYHNGTVWPWLLGHFATAYLKAKGYSRENVDYVNNLLWSFFMEQVSKAGLGTVSEIFDGDKPHLPRGCIAQAWSVAEPLRAYIEDALQVKPKYAKEVLGV